MSAPHKITPPPSAQSGAGIPSGQSGQACARELRIQGYNHTDSNHYARLAAKRKLDWAFIITEHCGSCSIMYRN